MGFSNVTQEEFDRILSGNMQQIIIKEIKKECKWAENTRCESIFQHALQG